MTLFSLKLKRIVGKIPQNILTYFLSGQGLIGDLVSEVFNINIEYLGSVASNFAKVTF